MLVPSSKLRPARRSAGVYHVIASTVVVHGCITPTEGSLQLVSVIAPVVTSRGIVLRVTPAVAVVVASIAIVRRVTHGVAVWIVTRMTPAVAVVVPSAVIVPRHCAPAD